MHRKLTEYEKFGSQNNQLLTNSCIEFKGKLSCTTTKLAKSAEEINTSVMKSMRIHSHDLALFCAMCSFRIVKIEADLSQWTSTLTRGKAVLCDRIESLSKVF